MKNKRMDKAMTLRNKFVKALEVLLSNENSATSNQKATSYETFLNQFTDKHEEFQKIRELEALVYGLSAKVTVLADKVHQLNDQIVNLTTLSEELLYTLGEGDEQEDNNTSVGLHFKMKKFELN